MTERTQNRFDILRLLAAFCVLVSHAYPISGQSEPDPFARWIGLDTLGSVGVIIFFTLSGYLVTLSWERSAGLWDFAWKRAIRIYPALLTVCMLTVLLLGPIVTDVSLEEYWQSSTTLKYLQTATGFNIQYALPGVFQNNPLPHALNGSLWSLPYEIKCYFALILLHAFKGSLKLKIGISLTCLIGILLQHPGHPPGNPFDKWLGLDYYQIKLGIPFAIGSFFAINTKNIKPSHWQGILFLSLIYLTPNNSPLKTLFFLIGTSILALSLALTASWIPTPPEKLGDWSYGVYLYGFPVQQLLAHIGLQHHSFSLYLAACSVITTLLAALSWFAIEKPALRYKNHCNNQNKQII